MSSEAAQFQKNLQLREQARIAFIKSDHDLKLRRAYLQRSRPERCSAEVGQWVMYWRDGKGALPGTWHGPARVVLREDPNVVWLTHLSRLYRCAPEHLRKLSSREAEALDPQEMSNPTLPEMPQRLGTGVFQYHDLTSQNSPTTLNSTSNSNDQQNSNVNTPDNTQVSDSPVGDAPVVPSNAPAVAPGDAPSTEGLQPDSEPPATVAGNSNSGLEEAPNVQPWEVPVPASDAEDADALGACHDEWLISKNQLIRKHHQPRFRLFSPTNLNNCPLPIEWLSTHRVTQIQAMNGSSWDIQDQWYGNIQAHQSLPNLWTGKTMFTIQPQYVSQAIQHQIIHTCVETAVQGFEIQVALNVEEIESCMKQDLPEQTAFLASAAKKQRSEVKERDLSHEEMRLFQGAKEKEIQSWLSTETVRKIARNQIPEEQILRSRWVLTWKPVEPTTNDPNPKPKPKARLVILGYEDPQLESLARDSPTLGKDSRTLILQYAASAKWKIRSFDIQTAFLRGSRQDGRILGMEPPKEMKSLMRLQPWECCELLKSAYGLVNAPLLWYEELKNALTSLQFKVSPLDPCTFVLPKRDGSGIHGLVGVHVDDGLGAGDQIFEEAIAQLERRYPFGSKKETDFIFTGIHLSQKWDGSIELDQTQYVEDIPSIDIDRKRRQEPDLPVTESERQALRGLVGSIQYAATNTRPDLSAKLSLLQAKINCATIKDLGEANKLQKLSSKVFHFKMFDLYRFPMLHLQTVPTLSRRRVV